VSIAMTNLLADANMLLVDDANNNGNAEESEILVSRICWGAAGDDYHDARCGDVLTYGSIA